MRNSTLLGFWKNCYTLRIYSLLLNLYLFHNDMDNVQFLWRRTLLPMKSANPELGIKSVLGRIWSVGQRI